MLHGRLQSRASDRRRCSASALPPSTLQRRVCTRDSRSTASYVEPADPRRADFGYSRALAASRDALTQRGAKRREAVLTRARTPPSARVRQQNRRQRAHRECVRLICRKPPVDQKSRRTRSGGVSCQYDPGMSCVGRSAAAGNWLRMSLPHASITHIVVRPSGDVSLRALGDAGPPPARRWSRRDRPNTVAHEHDRSADAHSGAWVRCSL